MREDVRRRAGDLEVEGTPQGAVISPLLSNLYLDPPDQQMAWQGQEMVRYADDFIILCRSEAEARETLEQVRRWTVSAGLKLHPVKTRIVDAKLKGGFDFLGYHFERGYRWPREKSRQKVRDTIRAKTRRTNGRSLAAIITDVNRTLRSWFEYFKHSHYTTFEEVDRWVRRRLHSVLRKRHGGHGCARGWDNVRWAPAFFAPRRLFSLAAAHAATRQSSRR